MPRGAAALVVVRVPIGAIVDVVTGLVPEVLVVAAGVVVRDEPIHRRRQPDAHDEAGHHERELRHVEAAAFVNAAHRLGQQAEGRRRQHQPGAEPQDAVVGPAREIAHEEERQRAQAGGQTGKDRGQSA